VVAGRSARVCSFSLMLARFRRGTRWLIEDILHLGGRGVTRRIWERHIPAIPPFRVGIHGPVIKVCPRIKRDSPLVGVVGPRWFADDLLLGPANIPLRTAPGPQRGTNHCPAQYAKKLIIRFHVKTYPPNDSAQLGQNLFKNYRGVLKGSCSVRVKFGLIDSSRGSSGRYYGCLVMSCVCSDFRHAGAKPSL